MTTRGKRQILLPSAVLVALAFITIGVIVSWNSSVERIDQATDAALDLSFYYHISDAPESYTDILQQPFVSAELNKAPGGFGNEERWLRLHLENPTNTVNRYRLVFDNPLLDTIDIYHRDPRFDELKHVTFGEQVDGLSSYDHASANLPFELSPGQNKQFWIHIKNDGARLLSINVLLESSFAEYERLAQLIWGTFIGISLVLAMYNTVLFIGLQDKAYLLYVAYLVSIFLLFGVIHGFGYYILPYALQKFFSQETVLLQSLVALTSLNFAAAFLKITPSVGWLYEFKQRIGIFIVLFGLISIPVSEHRIAPAFIFVQGIVYLTALGMIRYRIRERFHWTRYYLISWLPFFVGAAIGMMLFIGVLPYSHETRYAFLFSAMFEMTLISMALADRMGVTEKERLFRATHDVKTGLANDFFIEQKITQIQSKLTDTTIALVTVKFSNHDFVISYLTVENQKLLLNEMAKRFANDLRQQADIVYLDDQQQVDTSIIHNNIFSYLVRLTNERQLPKVLNTLSQYDNFNPVPDAIPFRIQCVFAGRMLRLADPEARGMINSMKQCLNIAQEQNSPYVIYHPELDHSSARGIRLAQDLEVAIADNRLSLFYQPQKHLHNVKACYSEVLVRWMHPELGFISPMEFVAIAEQTGLIKKLTNWVISCAFRQQHQLTQICNEGVFISINVSANDLSRRGFSTEVASLAQQYEVDPNQFTLEVTETSHHQDKETFTKNVNELKANGFSLAIDDFGTGYSSLTYVSELPFDELKIDRVFVKELVTSERQNQIVSATINMANDLGLSVTAEGIEDGETLAILETMNCHKIQGYFFAKPMAFEKYLIWLTKAAATQPL